MFASKIKLKEETARQKSSSGKILEWMQEHPSHCKNTNAAILAKSIALDGIGTVNSIRQIIQRMVNNQMLSRFGNKRRSNFYINYLHKDIPPYVLENAPEDFGKAREELEAGLKENQHLDEYGCVVTEAPVKAKKPEEKPEEPKEEAPEEEEEDDEEDYPELDSIIQKLNVPVLVRKEEKGGGTNISITLNLNLR